MSVPDSLDPVDSRESRAVASSAPTSTFRLQVRPGFDLHAVAGCCDYLATLGVGALYLSPLLPSTRGSQHGYDVVAFDGIDPQRGGSDGWTWALAGARARQLDVLIDIVPNHCGVGDAHQNAAWWDVLTFGPHSCYAAWFDIDWTHGRVLLPVLADGFEPSQLEIVDGELRYLAQRYPIAPGTEQGTAAEIHARQHYELVNVRRADTDQNYRRFFAVSSLAGLRVEDDAVFAATHVQIERWLREDGVTGLRVDHPDGLLDPLRYLTKLRELGGESLWLLVEKILTGGEQLDDRWPVDGTTGYESLAELTGLLLDPAAEPILDAAYRSLTHDERGCSEHLDAGKREIVTTILRAEVNRLARLAPDVAEAGAALAEILVAMPVYRTYSPTGAEHLAAALSSARQSRPDLVPSIDALAARLADPTEELCRRFQQTSGAVMAKGVEDTAFYRYTRFVALNEVGGNPARFALSVEQFHRAQWHRQTTRPRTMTTLSTHDTKRSEDVRARLAVLTELPDDWTELVSALMKSAPLPDAAFAYLLWQTIVGAGFITRDRLHAYVEKAMREAASFTTWAAPDATAESRVHAVVDRAYDDEALHRPLTRFIDRITPYGWSNSLSQKLIQLTMPGVPDVYQGTEVWDYSLVDPDNRRPVNLDAHLAMLDRLDAGDDPPLIDATGAAKLWIVSRALRLRRDWPELFTGYAPLLAEGSAAEHAVAFDRGGIMTVATRLPLGLERSGGWRDTVLDIGGNATDAISGRRVPRHVQLAELLSTYPVALLVR